ncbi:predicted protein [Scheffersomyces stipitis CBS 6054]|uniref:Uncharacterized protein n=1 Tax=Scheffersomyces stipitis (strain ATCC 58785 / CBS 6054 / NBRC 10063 / NRRL Y-11545) TaxID=322104 RepID=A3M040_PICST|nr:predicted protein [Scheffersomyces stipitis CBS 6054]ABN68649.1 predicted protein [Scheffersomyces stipitis CBS 6054]KAG2731111.1 hypothetical protein G9P44_006260 [Scheffersomyces stipitis]
MSAFGKIKCYLACFLLFYTFYLHDYKCHQVRESSPFDVGALIQPAQPYHNYVCGSLQTGSNNVHAFLDRTIHAHPLFIKYEGAQKLALLRQTYATYLFPVLKPVLQAVDFVEFHVVEHFDHQFHRVKALLVGAEEKVEEVKEAVEEAAE